MFSVTAGSLPPGLSLSAGGVISGTPSAGGTFNFTAHVIDSNGNTGNRAYALQITVPITVNPPSLPNGTVGTAYNQTFTASRRDKSLHICGDRGLAAERAVARRPAGR